MADARVALWLARGYFVLLTVLVLFFQLLPITLTPAQWAPPDIMLAVALAWAQRRPEVLPIWLTTGIFLLLDIMFQRPPGLWAALSLLAVEWFKTRERGTTDMGFVLEWLGVAGILVTMTLAFRGVLVLAAVDAGPLHLATWQAALTVLVYPLVVLLSHFIFGIRRAAPSDLDQTG